MTVAVVWHAACGLHEPGAGHPERPERLAAVLRRLGPEASPILGVDDDPDMVRLLARTIRGLGRYEVWQAFGGEEALALIRVRRPGAVLLDLLMPDVDGYAVLAALRADPGTANVPVVVVTARGATTDHPVSGSSASPHARMAAPNTGLEASSSAAIPPQAVITSDTTRSSSIACSCARFSTAIRAARW